MVMEKMKDHHQFEDHRFPTSPLTKSPIQATTPGRSTQSPSSSDQSFPFTENDGEKNQKTKLQRKGTSFIYRIREHVRMGPNFSDTVKGKLSVGAKIIKNGGRDNIFKGIFGVSDGEKLLKASQCYLSTTSGPIAGILFISTLKVVFCSERSISVQSSSGPGFIRTLTSDSKYMQFQVDGNLQYVCPTCRGECCQVRNLEEAVQELWRRRDESDKDLIASLRAAAGLPTQDEIFDISPFSDDEESGPLLKKKKKETEK